VHGGEDVGERLARVDGAFADCVLAGSVAEELGVELGELSLIVAFAGIVSGFCAGNDMCFA
jgi:hypothetical protein